MRKTIHRFLTLLIFTLISYSGFAQQGPMYSRNNDGSWTLGINAGTAWQQGDIKVQPGWGVGLTLGKNIWHRPGGLIDVDLRGRLLYTQTYGKDSRRDFAIQNNPVFNGLSGEALDYASDPGYLYQNHRTGIGELSLEGVLTANKLRERTGVIFSVFGGIGADLYQTKTDQLDLLGTAYDYTLIDSTANRGRVLRQLRALRDGEYETNAEGYQDGARISIMPSWGVGLGYQVTPTFSVGMEHKVTYALNDLLEGQRHATNTALSGNNDKYHYTSLYLRWKINGRNRYQNDPVSQGPGVIDPALPEPLVTITKPRDRTETEDSKIAVTATIQHVSRKQDVECRVNGNPITNFTFNERTNKFATVVPLIPGYNEIRITGSNSVGIDKDEVSVIYNEIIPVTPVYPDNPTYPDPNDRRPPVVQINVPSSNPAYTDNAYGVIKATIRNVSNRNGITFTVNGYRTNNFNYDAYANSFVADYEWKPGRNEVVISAVNLDGSDSDSRTIYYEGQQDNNRPTIDIIQPDSDPYTTEASSVNVKVVVSGARSRNDISMRVNGGYSNNFNYSQSSGIITTTLNNLSTGNTRVEFSVNNGYGTDSDDLTIVYCPATYGPSVSITKPSNNPYTTSSSSTMVLASIYGISSRDQITFKVNGAKTNDFSYDSSNQSFASTVSLTPGNNTVSISVSTNGGSDSDSRTIIYNQPTPKPVVTITKPANDPHTANEKVEFVKATIQNVDSRNNVTLSVNGVSTNSFSYNSYNGAFSAEIPLVVGNNEVVITGTNAAGSDSDDVTIYYEAPIPAPTVTITSPSQNPYNTTAREVTVRAKITEVTSKRGINFRWNGARITDYSFNSNTGILEGQVTARTGNNSISITATNPSGSDSDSRTIIYTIPIEKPVVQFIQPGPSHSVTEKDEAIIKATVKHVKSKENITFTVNGRTSKNFSFNTATNTLNATIGLKPGKNTVQVTATNPAGTDSDGRTINYDKPTTVIVTPPVTRPEVTITRPASYNEVSPSETFKVQATITGLTGSTTDKVVFKVNGRINKNFSFNHKTTQFSSTISLNEGDNNIEITATNANGSDKDAKTIIYNCPNPDPVFDFRNPMSSPMNVSDKDFRMSLFVHNASKDDITVWHNGRVKPFSFNQTAKFLECVLVLSPGQNVLKVRADNPCGSKTETVIVNYVAPSNKPSGPSKKPSGPSISDPGETGSSPTPTVNPSRKPGSGKVNTSGSTGSGKVNTSRQPTTSGKKPATDKATTTAKPTVTLISPTSSSKTMSVRGTTTRVKAKVDGVAGKSNIRVIVNGKPVSNFSYNGSTKMVEATVNLKAGSSSKVEIVAINSKGQARKTMNLTTR